MLVDYFAKPRQQIETLAKKHNISRIPTKTQRDWQAFISKDGRKICNVPDVVDAFTYTVNLHEFGHLIYKKAYPTYYRAEMLTAALLGYFFMDSMLKMELEANRFVFKNSIIGVEETAEYVLEQYLTYVHGAAPYQLKKVENSRLHRAILEQNFAMLGAVMA